MDCISPLFERGLPPAARLCPFGSRESHPIGWKRTLKDGRKLVKYLKNSLDGHIPFFTSDDLPHYANALLAVYGLTKVALRGAIEPPRTGTAGRPRHAYKVPPEDLLYAVVCNPRRTGAYGARVRASSKSQHESYMDRPNRKWPFEGPSLELCKNLPSQTQFRRMASNEIISLFVNMRDAKWPSEGP